MSNLSILFAGGAQSAPVGAAWGSRFVRTTEALAYGGGVYVAAGPGFVDSSADGVSWAPRAAPGDSISARRVIWANSQFLLVGRNNAVRTSPDGANWTARTSGAGGSQEWASAAYGAGKFVVVGKGGQIITSPDGVTWTARTSGTSVDLNDIVWNGSKFLVVCNTNISLSSADGVSWTIQGTGISYFNTVAWGNSLFVATNAGVFYSSPDGATWTARSGAMGDGYYRIIWTGSLFLAVGYNFIIGASATSPDGVTWTDRSAAMGVFQAGTFPFGAYPAELYDAVWNGSSFLTVGRLGSCLSTTNGVTWTGRTTPPWALNTVAYGAGRFVAFSGSLAFVSYDGRAWSLLVASGVGNTQKCTIWNGSQFVSVGAAGSIYTSPDGLNWTARTSGTSNDLSGVAWSGSQFVAVGASGYVRTSPDGVTWTARSVGGSPNLQTVSWGGGVFVIGGAAGGRWSSPDGVTWTDRGLVGPGYPDFKGSAWNGSVFAMVGNTGVIYTSADGATWTLRTSPTTSSLLNVAWGGGLFVACGDNGTVVTSSTGVTWVVAATPYTAYSYAGSAYGNNTFVTVSQYGDVIESPPPSILTY